jgi:signal transduction histidine kinase
VERLGENELKRLLDVGRSLVAERDLETLLMRVVEAARELTGARYAALGVLDASKRQLERFLYLGVDEQTRTAIGPLPRGHGILGELIRHPEPLRLRRISDHPRSYGFPAHHPKMTTFAGVPVTIRDEVYGNLYLSEKAGDEEFTERDERLLVVLAEWAAIAIENARAYETAERRRLELERAVHGLQANASLSRELSGETDAARVMELIAKRGRALVEARSLMALTTSEGGYAVVECAGEHAAELNGRELDAAGSPVRDAILAGAPVRLESAELRWFRNNGLEAESALIVPLRRGPATEGVLVALDRHGDDPIFTADDELVLDSFATSAAAAIVTSRALESDKVKLSIAAGEQERQRWARELHDETLQELSALKVMQEAVLQTNDPEALRRAIAHSVEQVEGVISGLDGLIAELRPAALDQLGTAAAIEILAERLAARSGLDVEVDADLAFEAGRAETRHAPELEAAVYRIAQEALNNVVKHAGATRARVAVVENDYDLRLTVEDDGSGISQTEGDRQGFGLIGMRERAEQQGGTLEIGEAAGGGTRVVATMPVERAPAG